MRKWIVLLLSLCAPARGIPAPSPAGPALPPLSETASAASAAYCRYVEGVSASNSAVLLWPELYLNFGVINATGVTTGESGAWPTALRLTAGLRYSGQHLHRGLLDRQRAQAECERYRALSDLTAFYLEAREGSRPALLAKAAVLVEALPRAQQIVAEIRELLKKQRAAADELSATEIRADVLRAEAAQARQEAEGLPEPSPQRPSIAALLKARSEAEDRVEALEGRLRRAQAWDLSLNAGYDRVFVDGSGAGTGAGSSQVPIVALASLTVNPGGLWQLRADGGARQGRREFTAHELDGAEQRALRMMSKLRAQQRSERARLRETGVLMTDLSARMKAVETMDNNSQQIRQYRDYLWFDWVRVRAEHAYLAAHLLDMERWIPDGEAAE